MPMIRVVAAVVDTKQLTLYKEDGTTLAIPQGDPRLAPIVETITPILTTPGAVAEVEVEDRMDAFAQFEAESNGLVQLFRVAKQALTTFFSLVETEISKPKTAPPVKPLAIGAAAPMDTVSGSMFVERTPIKESDYAALVPLTPETDTIRTAIAEIMAHAKPLSSTDPVQGEEAMVAMVGGQMIPNVERLEAQVKRAVSGSRVGLDNFMKRISAVITERHHSIDDLLKFLERGDLPIADDGSIVIYKVLRKSENGYVDCHTRQVNQRVGSYVCMHPSLVDPDRRNECSNGLHVARRAYVGGFSGDVVVLAKVAPEDVIAVPDHDANKMRVCGYHIIFELSDAAYQLLKNNRPFTETDEAQILLGRVLSGDHDAPIERVEITEDRGGGVKITPIAKIAPSQPAKKSTKKATALSEDSEGGAEPVDPKAISAAVVKAKTESRSEKARRLFNEYATCPAAEVVAKAQALLDFKKSAKVSWEALGLTIEQGEEVKEAAQSK